jgi:hypothetical protein
MSVAYSRELTQLGEHLRARAVIVESLFDSILCALPARDGRGAVAATERAREEWRNGASVEAEGLVLMAEHKPAAESLRQVVASIKMAISFRRVLGVLATIAPRIEALAGHPEVSIPDGVEKAGADALRVLRQSLEAWRQWDEGDGRTVPAAVTCERSVAGRSDAEIVERIARDRANAEAYEQCLGVLRAFEIVSEYVNGIADDVAAVCQ